ncbi:hypothetical protein BDW72DRAFT_196440 [Aspergillus terricola var. indicus]
MIDFSGKVIAVTGGASGIGRSTVKLLASLGAKVSIGDLQEEALQVVAKEIKDAGHVDVLVQTIDVKDFDSDEWDFVMDINLKGVMHCMRAEIRAMADNGSIVNAASIAGVMGFQNNAAYCASKHGVVGLTRAAAKEVGQQNIRVNCIAPGAVQTPMLAKSHEINGNSSLKRDIALARAGEPEEVANLVVFLLGDASSFITGATYSIDGGWAC